MRGCEGAEVCPSQGLPWGPRRSPQLFFLGGCSKHNTDRTEGGAPTARARRAAARSTRQRPRGGECGRPECDRPPDAPHSAGAPPPPSHRGRCRARGAPNPPAGCPPRGRRWGGGRAPPRRSGRTRGLPEITALPQEPRARPAPGGRAGHLSPAPQPLPVPPWWGRGRARGGRAPPTRPNPTQSNPIQPPPPPTRSSGAPRSPARRSRRPRRRPRARPPPPATSPPATADRRGRPRVLTPRGGPTRQGPRPWATCAGRRRRMRTRS